MRRDIRTKAGFAALFAASLALASPARADYFIRPYVALGNGAVVDGFEENGATSGAATFTTALQSYVDLSAGTSRNYLQLTGPSVGGSGFGQSAGIFGDRITFSGAEGSTVGFSFAFDGTIMSPARPNPNSTMQIGVVANLRVFDQAAGATSADFATKSGALVSDTAFLDFSNPTSALNEMVARTLAGSLVVSGSTSYDVFASLSIFASLNDNPATVTMDFLNTGTFGIQTAPGVSYTSDSGVFLADQPAAAAVPEPASWAMMLLGFGLAGGAVRRRRGRMAAA